MFGISPSLMVVRTSLGAKDVKDFVALAKKEPGKVTYASSAIGSAPHLDGELFQTATGTKLLHVPYNGAAPIIQALLGDTVDMYIGGASTVMPNVKAGKLVVLGAAHPTRLQSAPDVPTLAEQGIKGVEGQTFTGLLAPANTPKAVIDKLGMAMKQVLENETVVKKFYAAGAEAHWSSPQDFTEYLQKEESTWLPIIKAANIKAE